MFAQSLPNTKKRELLKIVRLLQTFDAPLLWGGKTEEEITGNTDLSDISFKISDSIKELWVNAVRIYGDDKDLNEKDSTGVIDKLLDEIRGLRITRQNDKDERLKIATDLLSEAINGQGAVSKIVGPALAIASMGISEIIATGFSEDISSKSEKTSACTKTHLRIVLFEAMRLSGVLTDSKRNLLQVASVAYGIDGESFNELLAQALALHKEMKRSVNLVLE
ncbi:hypothetical protein JAO85_24600 [Comamonas sp. NyZ500]|uniref:hypothetical protein n=1 Tax=Comamonas sp. NyZ500 TaxID=2795732 RepID=UPI00192CA79B|nr:hypothetical protein [Comamonas sp. NyZ500]MBL5980449.1 hypothetical protein [Comamonas sp. NyZ500]